MSFICFGKILYLNGFTFAINHRFIRGVHLNKFQNTVNSRLADTLLLRTLAIFTGKI